MEMKYEDIEGLPEYINSFDESELFKNLPKLHRGAMVVSAGRPNEFQNYYALRLMTGDGEVHRFCIHQKDVEFILGYFNEYNPTLKGRLANQNDQSQN